MDKQQFIQQYGKQRFVIVEQSEIYIKARFGDIDTYALAADHMLVEGQPLEQVYPLLVKIEGLAHHNDNVLDGSNVCAFPASKHVSLSNALNNVRACT